MRRLYTTSSQALGLTPVVFTWRGDGEAYAAAGQRRSVAIYDRNGQLTTEVRLPDSDFEYDEQLGAVQSLAWHPGGRHLAVLPRGQTFAMVWDAATGEVARVDGGIKQEEVCFVTWCPSRPLLALGTVKGTALVYDCDARRLTPLPPQHTRPLCCGCWSYSGVLVLGSWDGTLSLCRGTADGADAGGFSSSRLACSLSLRGRPADVQFCSSAADGACLYLSVSVARRSVLVWEVPLALVSEAVLPCELNFPDRYGQLECHAWVGTGLAGQSRLAAGFSSGQVVVVGLGGGSFGGGSLGPSVELFSCRLLSSPVASLAWCPGTEHLTAGGGPAVAVLHCSCPGSRPGSSGGGGADSSGSITLLRSEGLELEGGQHVAQLGWSPSGDLLTVATRAGRLAQYLAHAHLLHASHGSLLAYATSLSEVVVQNAATPKAPSTVVRLEAEPELLALGPTLLAAAREGQMWLHSLRPDSCGLLSAPQMLEFPEPIVSAALNAQCMALLGQGGRVFVQELGDCGSHAPTAGCAGELCGADGCPHAAACVALTPRHVAVGLPDGMLALYSCDAAVGFALAGEHAHGAGIARLFASPADERLVFQDDSGASFLYDLAARALMPLADAACGQVASVLWDVADPRLLVVACAGGTLLVFLHIPASVAGHGVKLLARQGTPHNLVPLVACGGVVTSQTGSGQLDCLVLDTHGPLLGEEGEVGDGSEQQDKPGLARLAARYQAALALCHLPRALDAAAALGDPAALREVGGVALQLLDVSTAVAAYRAAGDSQLADTLAPLAANTSEPDLLAGQLIPLLGGDVERAEALLLRSSQPVTALELRQELGQWGEAVRLARKLAPSVVGGLALEQARAAQADGRVDEAAALYEEALGSAEVAADPAAAAEARAALARCCCSGARAEQGAAMALASGDTALCAQCAVLLEAQHLLPAAARLYDAAGQADAAALLFLRAREFGAADALSPRLRSRDVRLALAQAKEDLGQWAAAAAAYQAAGDTLAAVRVHLQRLRDPAAAAALAGDDPAAAALLAAHYEAAGQAAEAVAHYCRAGDCNRGFALAHTAGCMGAFADWVRSACGASPPCISCCNGSSSSSGGGSVATGPRAQALLVAAYFESQLDLPAAADMFALGGQAQHAVALLLRAGGANHQAMAVALAERSRDPALVDLLAEHLAAKEGGGGRELVRLHLAVGQSEQACSVALATAQQAQTAGNYKAARDELVAACSGLAALRAPATPALLSALALLHSYLLVGPLVRAGDHAGAARLLLRCAEQIDSFPAHVVPILTSTVIECHRAGLATAAQRWAVVLQGPEHAAQVGRAYQRKIEAIARRPTWADPDPPEPSCDCLFCGAPGPESALACASCHSVLPFCLATGARVALPDWSECPRCHLPCRGTALARLVGAGGGSEGHCPLCEGRVGPHDVRRVWDAFAQLRATPWCGLLGGRAAGQQTGSPPATAS